MAIETPAPSVIPQKLVVQAAYWIREFSLDLHRELPQRIHGFDHDGYGVIFHPEFIEYIDRPCKRGKRCHDLACTHDMLSSDPPPRKKATRAFRNLRQMAPREFDVMWLMCVKGLSLPEVATALTDRAIRLGKPERYSEISVLLLTIAGIDKLLGWY